MPQQLKYQSVLDNKEFESGIARLEKRAAQAAQQIDKVFGGKLQNIATRFATPQQAAISTALSGLNLASSIGAKIGAGVAQTFNAGRAVQQLARATGGGVAGLVILEDKFKKAGLEGERVATSIFRLQKSLAGVEDEENKGGAKALAGLGLNLAQIRKSAPDQQLMAVGRAISTISDPAQRTATAMQIFGRTGAELGAVFNGSDFNRISPELQRKADLLARNSEAFERASRSIQRVSNIVQTSANTFYGGVAEGVVGGLQPLLDDMKSVNLTAMGQGFGDALAKGAVAIHKMLDELKASGLVELGQRVAAGAVKGVEVAGDAAKLAGVAAKPSAQGGAVMAAASLIGRMAVGQVSRGLDAMHVVANASDFAKAEFTRRSEESYAERHNNPADPGVASTDRRPETRAVNNRPITMPEARHALTLPDPARRLPLSAPGGMPTASELYEQEWRGRQVAAAVQNAAPTGGRVTIAGDDQTHLVRMALSNGGMKTAGMSPDAIGKLAASHVYMGGSVDAAGNANDPYTMRVDSERRARVHTVGRGTALDFDPSTQAGWTGARDAFANFSKDDWRNYRGTSGNGYGGHTGLTSGGLGGGAYGRRSDIMTQISGRVGGGKDATAETAKNTGTLITKVQELIDTWNGKGGGGSSGGGGATATR